MIKYCAFKYFWLLTLIALLLLNSCGSRNKQSLFNGANYIDPEMVKDVYVINDQGQGDIYYKIKVNDVISVRNLQNMEFGVTGSTESSVSASTKGDSGPTFPVDVTGTVNLPAIGKVLLAGLTRREATLKLQELYEAKSLKNPIIELTIVNVKVTMLGEFNIKGNFLLERDNTTLIDMIGQAGGLTKDADPRTLRIIRGDKSNPEIILANLTNINTLANKKIILQNNDIIVVEPTKNVVAAAKLQNMNNIIQPLLVVVNLAILVFTLTR